MIVAFTGTVFLYPGESGAWHFLPVPKAEGARIKAAITKKVQGFGSLRVKATMNNVSWETSIFPDKISRSYLLPLKASVRKAVGIAAGDRVGCVLELTGLPRQ